MKVVKSFEEYISEGVARKITPDRQRAKSLFLESERKYELLQRMINQMGIDEDNANDYVEYCYNIVMFLIRARMLEGGFISSGHSAHEAEVAYARDIGLTDPELEFLDQLRYFRNGILYYGKRFDADYAQKTLAFANKMYVRFKV